MASPTQSGLGVIWEFAALDVSFSLVAGGYTTAETDGVSAMEVCGLNRILCTHNSNHHLTRQREQSTTSTSGLPGLTIRSKSYILVDVQAERYRVRMLNS